MGEKWKGGSEEKETVRRTGGKGGEGGRRGLFSKAHPQAGCLMPLLSGRTYVNCLTSLSPGFFVLVRLGLVWFGFFLRSGKRK